MERLSAAAEFIIRERYAHDGETWDDIVQRVANVISRNRDDCAEYERAMKMLRFIPNTPTFTGAGTAIGQMAACFVVPISDNLGSEPDGIFSAMRTGILIQQTGGGVGFNFGTLRPRGSRISSSRTLTTGPISFMHAYDAAFSAIAQGGVRRGANMATMRVDHPDVLDFVDCKAKEGALTFFNISVQLTNEFMSALRRDPNEPWKFAVRPEWGLTPPTTTVGAIFDKICKAAWSNGEPGVLFPDAANEDNPVPHLYTLAATNPCGEQWLGPYECCTLGHINLARVVVDGAVNFDLLRELTHLGVRFLDNVVDANGYVPAVPEIRAAALATRRIGLGITGLADMFIKIGLRYGSPDSVVVAGKIMRFIRREALIASCELARQFGAFPEFARSRWADPTNDFFKKNGWDDVEKLVRAHGLRNSCLLTVAPTGTTSMILGVEGSGCEPIFSLSYSRYVSTRNNEREKITYVSTLFEQAIRTEVPNADAVIEAVRKTGVIPADVPERIRNLFVVAADVKPEEHIAMQAELQKWVDNSISKTINCPHTTSVEDVKRMYMLAWELNLKGLTIYRERSRETEVLVAAASARPQTPSMTMVRPRVLRGATYSEETEFGSAHIVVNEDVKGDPFEVFVTTGKSGHHIMFDCEAIGRLASLVLRLRTDASQSEKLRLIEAQLSGIGGEKRRLGVHPSIPDAVASAIAEHRGDNADKIEGTRDYCPECRAGVLIFQEHCKRCNSCGYTACS